MVHFPFVRLNISTILEWHMAYVTRKILFRQMDSSVNVQHAPRTEFRATNRTWKWSETIRD